MDIDKDFMRGLGIPSDTALPKPKMGNIDVEVSDSPPVGNPKTVAETAEDAISAMSSNPIISDNNVDAEQQPEIATIVVETKKVPDIESYNSQDTITDITELLSTMSKISEELSKMSKDVSEVKTSISKFDGYDKAVETLKRSLTIHQNNEENIYKELETYKKNQYYNYIRPFLEFLINLLTDMINSKKQYENDYSTFVSQHGQEIYDEIVELHDFYIQQIESQLQIQGVEIINHESETPFIPTEQVISKPILTDDVTLSGMIGRVDSACYKFQDKILKKAKVHVYKVRTPKDAM